jgi:hypothetical protein
MESPKKIFKDSESETYCTMSAFLDWLVLNFDQIVNLEKDDWKKNYVNFYGREKASTLVGTTKQTLYFLNDWNEPPKMSYKLVLFDFSHAKYVLLGAKIYKKIKKVFHHFILDFIMSFNAKSEYLKIFDFEHNMGAGAVVVSFDIAIKEGLDLDVVLNKLKEKNVPIA